MQKWPVAVVVAAWSVTTGIWGPSAAGAEVQSPLAVSSPTSQPSSRPSLFDPARHMRVSEVRIGMKGYGLTVFHGTKIERFPIEVVDIVRNFNPGLDAVLIQSPDERMKHVGAVQGMSGSPIFVTDDAGHDRLIGAFAFGWGLSKDPLVGVQPIEYMLEIANPGDGVKKTDETASIDGGVGEGRRAAGAQPLWNYADALKQAALPMGAINQNLSLSVSGMSPVTMDALSPALAKLGMPAFRAVSAGGPAGSTTYPSAKIEPGSSLVVPIMRGDIEMAALGTCTEVIGDRVFGFGHPFQNSGEAELPMAAGYVNTIVASLNASFKLGGATDILGTLSADTAVGIGGRLGAAKPTMIPISLRLVYADGSIDRTFHFEVVRHPRFTALGTISALIGSLSAIHELPAHHTLDVQSVVSIAGKPDVRLGNVLSDAAPIELVLGLGLPLAALAENPFEKVYPRSIDMTVKVENGARQVMLSAARTSRTHVRPGETLSLFVDYERFQKGPDTKRIEFPIPANLEPGQYSVVVSDAQRFQQDDQVQRPERLYARSLDGVIAVMNERSKQRADRYYVRLTREPDGVSLGRVGYSRMPGTKRQILANTSRADVAPTARPIVLEVPAEGVVSGAVELSVTVLPPVGAKAKEGSGGAGGPGNAGGSGTPGAPHRGGVAPTGSPAPGGLPALPGGAGGGDGEG